MFVYCNRCKWSQDDFWHEGYNPYDFMCSQGDKDLLFGGKLDEVFMSEKYDSIVGFIGQEPKTNREHLVKEMQRWAEKIKKQRWITIEQYRKENPDRKCPVCGEILTED